MNGASIKKPRQRFMLVDAHGSEFEYVNGQKKLKHKCGKGQLCHKIHMIYLSL